MAYGGFKDFTGRTASDKILHDKAFSIAENRKYDGYERSLASVVYQIFYRKTSGGASKNENISNKELAEELHKPIIKYFKKRKVHSSFIDNVWGVDLADMELISKFNKGICFLLNVINHCLVNLRNAFFQLACVFSVVPQGSILCPLSTLSHI